MFIGLLLVLVLLYLYFCYCYPESLITRKCWISNIVKFKMKLILKTCLIASMRNNSWVEFTTILRSFVGQKYDWPYNYSIETIFLLYIVSCWNPTFEEHAERILNSFPTPHGTKFTKCPSLPFAEQLALGTVIKMSEQSYSLTHSRLTATNVRILHSKMLFLR